MKRILASCVILGLCTQAFATVTPPTLTGAPYSKRMYVGFGVGDAFTRVSGDNYLATGTGWPDDHYSVTNSSDAPFGFVSGGYAWERPSSWLPSYALGIRYMYVTSTKVSGYIDQYSLPDFRNYYYSYDVQFLNLLGTVKVDLYRWHNIMPYIILAAGVTNYTTTDYTEIATPNVTARVSPGFSENGANVFSYQYGAGLDFAVRENFWVNVEFNYANYGTVRTGKGANYATLTGTNYDNESLSCKIAATSVFLGLTFFTA